MLIEHFTGELLAAYPDAKYILTIRDPVKWHQSATDTIYYPFASPAYALHRFFYRRPYLTSQISSYFFTTFFANQFPTRGAEKFLAHNELCKEVIPSNQLLVYEVKDGWAPLCAFLGKEVPLDEKGEVIAFPRENEGKAMHESFVNYEKRLYRLFGAWVVGGVAVVGLVLLGIRHRQKVQKFLSALTIQ